MPPYFEIKKLPQRDLMSVYNSSAAWRCRLCPLDATLPPISRAASMPKSRLTLRPSRRPKHASWERNEAAKIALGPKFATRIWQGIIEKVPLNCPCSSGGAGLNDGKAMVAPHPGRSHLERDPG
jgi:hypothetical protein